MCAKQIEAQVKMHDRPDRARSHVKTWPAILVSDRYAIKPTHAAKAMLTIGRPFLSMYAKILGAWPCTASAASVREEPNSEEFATERTDIMITVFMTESSPMIPASVMAMTKGDAFESTLDRVIKDGWLYGTSKPMMAIERT